MADQYIKYREMLDALKLIDTGSKKVLKTFMEVGGYPHFENVASNILSFFFTSDEEHGLNDLFFKSLLEIIFNDENLESQNVSAEREYITLSNNRIDIVLSNDSYILGIENKIFSSVQNDLEDYKEKINKIAIEEDKKGVCILLSLKNENEIALSNTFINITYDMLFSSIKRNIGDYIESADNTWLVYFKDFMRTIYELQNGGNQMNRELLSFIDENNEAVGKLLNECISLKRELSQQTKNLSTIVDLEKYKTHMNFNEFCYNPKVYITSSFVIDIFKGDKKTIVIETYIDASGWHIALWNRFGKLSGKRDLENKLKKLGYKTHNYNRDEDSKSLFIVLEDYDHDVAFSVLADSIYEKMDLAREIEIPMCLNK